MHTNLLFLRYMLAEGLGLSGIVSILFTGIVSGYGFHKILWSPIICWSGVTEMFCYRSWSVIHTQICQKTLNNLHVHFSIWYHRWQRHLCKWAFIILISYWLLKLAFLAMQINDYIFIFFVFYFYFQIYLHGLWYCHGKAQLVTPRVYLFLNCILGSYIWKLKLNNYFNRKFVVFFLNLSSQLFIIVARYGCCIC